MKIAIPVAILVVLIISVFAFSQIGKSSKVVPVPSANVAVKEVPVTGNPDDVALAVESAAQDEQKATLDEEVDGASVPGDTAEAGSLEGAFDESDF